MDEQRHGRVLPRASCGDPSGAGARDLGGRLAEAAHGRPRPRAGRPDWDGVRLHVVTGKGGTGKTTVAAALALALASGGRSVLLVEVEGRQGIAQLFDSPPLPYEERAWRSRRAAATCTRLAVDPEDALLEYLEMFYNVAPGRSGCSSGSAPSTSPPRSRPACATCCSPARPYEAVRRKDGRDGP